MVAAVRAHIARQGGLRPGDEVLLRRFLVDREVYPDPSPAVDLSMIAHFEFVASRPRLAWIVMTVADAQFWAPQFAGINFHKLSDDPLVGDRSIAVFVRDTRERAPSSTRCGQHPFRSPRCCHDRSSTAPSATRSAT